MKSLFILYLISLVTLKSAKSHYHFSNFMTSKILFQNENSRNFYQLCIYIFSLIYEYGVFFNYLKKTVLKVQSVYILYLFYKLLEYFPTFFFHFCITFLVLENSHLFGALII